MKTPAHFEVKNFEFSKIFGVSARTMMGGGGWASADILWTRGSIFCDFEQTSFMDGPLQYANENTLSY